MRRRAIVGLALAVFSDLLFSVNGTVSKTAMMSGLTSESLVSARSAGAGIILLVVTAIARPTALRLTRSEWRFYLVYGVVGVAMIQWLYLKAIARLPVGIALLFEYTAPIMVALWVRFVRGEAVRPRLWWALGLSLGGLALVGQLWSASGRETLDPIGVACGLGSAVALATYYLMGEHGQRDRDALSVTALSFGVAGAFWAVFSPWWAFPFDRLGDAVPLPGLIPGEVPLWLVIAWVVVLGTVAPYFLAMSAVGHLGATRVGLLGMLEPVAAGAIAWVLLGEALTSVQLAGSSVVLVGIALAETARTRRASESGGDGGPPATALPEGVAP